MERVDFRQQTSASRPGLHGEHQLLILDPNPNTCLAERCCSVDNSLQANFPSVRLQPRHSRIPDFAVAVPDVVVLRAAPGKLAQELISSCRGRWSHAGILALLCPRQERRLEEFSSILDGVDDFLACPVNHSELVVRLGRLLAGRPEERRSSAGRTPDDAAALDSLVGESDRFQQAREKIRPLAQSSAAVLICGETGTGKELFARALHYQGPRRGGPFIPVNCGALPDHLFENELFGHAKGAFTDAGAAQKGLIAEAEGGTLFLDEIDALSSSAQIKLLRFLQDGEFRLLGSSRSLTADVRVIAATNADLRASVELQRFRADLYHRINVLSLAIPPLRDRAGDIPLLAASFLDRYSRQYGRSSARFSPSAVQKLMRYQWPGNVRELEAAMQRVVVLYSVSIVEPEHIELPGPESDRFPANNTLREAKSIALGGFERRYIADLLTTHQGNVSRAARAAGKDRRTLQRLLRKYGLDRHSFGRI